LGELDKATVRERARELALPGAGKGESQELCFVPTGRYDSFVAERAADRLRPGPIVDETGRPVGQHDGVHGFTVGQRKNLGVSLGKRAYVTAIEPETATVRLGERDALLAGGALVSEPVLAPGVSAPFEAGVMVRYRGVPVPARVTSAASGLRVDFDRPVTAVVPGQYAVFLDGERVLGGGVIAKPVPVEAAGNRPSSTADTLGGAP
jgi:tRNA-specific 2-thiouridylase